MITTQHLSKEYSIKREENTIIHPSPVNNGSIVKAVDDVSFFIPEGEVVGLLGSGGAGKTTLLKLISGTLQSTGGIIRLFGKDPCRNRRDTGYIIGTVFGNQTQLWRKLPLIDSFEMIKSMYHIPDNEYKKMLHKLCEALCLQDCLNVIVNELSLGQRVRADFISCILHNPKLLLLDEPTIAVDLAGKEQMNRILKNFQYDNGATIVMTTNDLGEIEKLCTRVMIMDQGKIIFDGEPRRFKSEYASVKTMKAELIEGLPDFQDLPITKYFINNKTLLIYYDSKLMNKSTILGYLLKQCRVRDIQTIETDIEDIVRNIYEKN